MGLIILFGIKHCGKTSLGRILADSFSGIFFDLDQIMLELENKGRKSVREIWIESDKIGFETLEEHATRKFVEYILPCYKKKSLILSLGGGTGMNADAMSWLNNRGYMVYLRAELQILYDRIISKGKPPFISEEHPWDDFQELYKKRDRIYEEMADTIVNVDDSPRDINAQRLLVKLDSHHVR